MDFLGGVTMEYLQFPIYEKIEGCYMDSGAFIDACLINNFRIIMPPQQINHYIIIALSRLGSCYVSPVYTNYNQAKAEKKRLDRILFDYWNRNFSELLGG